MEDDMAPPNKRRRLSGSRSQSLPSHDEDPSPTLLHSVQHLEQKPTSTAAHTVPKRIEEIHFQIQERAIARGDRAYQPLQRRQATAVESLVTSVDALGQTIVTEITIGATTATPTTGSTSDTSATSASSNLNISSSSNISGSATLGISRNGTATHSSTKHSTGNLSDHKTSSVYTTKLHNDHVVTLTRSDKPYKTTFADGQIFTICAVGHTQCALQSSDVTASSGVSSASSTAGSALTSTAYAAGSPAQGPEASPSSSTGAGVQHNNNTDNSVPPAGTIAGGVVGGAAGLAMILLLAMVLLRWYKRRRQLGHHALPPSSLITSDPGTPSSRGPGMAERAGLRPFAAAVPGFFKHQNRSDIEPPPSERSFQKVSGRKLPSAFSEGMVRTDMGGPAPSVPSTHPDRNYSSLSFYRDSQGFYGGEGDAGGRAVSPDDVPPLHSDTGGVLLSPGPQRRPTVHTGGPYLLTPSSSTPSTPHMQSPNLATIPGSPPDHPSNINRSSTSSTVPDNRSSRFTEEV